MRVLRWSVALVVAVAVGLTIAPAARSAVRASCGNFQPFGAGTLPVGKKVTYSFSSTSPYDATVSWGDGASSHASLAMNSSASVSHAYSAAGDYHVSLQVVGAACSDNVSLGTITVVAPQPPVAKFSFSPAAPLTGQQVNFDASKSSDPDGDIASYAWAFGDGSHASGKTTTHAYAAPGQYTVTVTVKDSGGRSDQQSATVSVSAVPDTTPPAAPGNLRLTGGAGQITLTWDPNTEADLDHYALERSTGGAFAAIGQTRDTTYTDAGLVAGTTYSYRVAAIDLAGNVSALATAAGVVAPPAGSPPPPPGSPPPVPGATPAPSSAARPGLQHSAQVNPNNTVTATQAFIMPSTRRCVSRRNFVIRIVRPPGVRYVVARVLVNGRPAHVFVQHDRYLTLRGRQLVRRRTAARVDLRGFEKGRFTATIQVVTATFRQVAGTRQYRTCTAKRAHGKPKL